jgi:hypothetical protein
LGWPGIEARIFQPVAHSVYWLRYLDSFGIQDYRQYPKT